MHQALELAATARLVAPPNPWVGCVIEDVNGRVHVGATETPGNRHAEIVALDAAHSMGADLAGATVYTTLEPCSHTGRTGPCVDALIAAGVGRVVSALTDPDPHVAGRGFTKLREAGIEVCIGRARDEATRQLAPYLHHRRTGRPLVVLKLATTIDGRAAAADGSSQWITGLAARTAVHALRAESGAVVVGAGTVRADDPSLTTRLVEGPSPRRIVLGRVADDAQVQPCEQWSGSPRDLIETLGSQGIVQVLVEGGPHVAGSFHELGLVDRYVIHMAPAFMGGDDALPMIAGLTGRSMSDVWRGRVSSMRMLDDDIEIVIEPPFQSEETQ